MSRKCVACAELSRTIVMLIQLIFNDIGNVVHQVSSQTTFLISSASHSDRWSTNTFKNPIGILLRTVGMVAATSLD